jgi:dihydroorotase
MPNTKPVNDNRAITEMMVPAPRSGRPAPAPVRRDHHGQKGEELTEMADMRDAGAIGVSDDGRCVMNAPSCAARSSTRAPSICSVSQHAEDHHLTEGAQMHEGAISTRLGLRGWPREAEDIIVARDVILASAPAPATTSRTSRRLGAVRIVREAKSRGLSVTAEVTPHHLLLTDAALIGYDTPAR